MNELRQTIQNELDERQQMLVKEKLNKQLAEETIDVSLPVVILKSVQSIH